MCGLNFTGGGLIRNADSLFHLSPAEWDWGWPRDLCFNQSPGGLEVWVALAWMALWATRYIAMQESGEFKSIFPTLAVSTLGLFLPCVETLQCSCFVRTQARPVILLRADEWRGNHPFLLWPSHSSYPVSSGDNGSKHGHAQKDLNTQLINEIFH